MRATIAFYFAVFLSRIHYFILIFALVTAASITVAQLLPAVYISRTRLLVESSQIPNQLAAPTVTISAMEELQIIEQRLMTRVNLLDIARSENVFEDIGVMSADDIVQGMRDATTIRRNAGTGQATLMNIEFEADSGQIAAGVVNKYVTLILQDNAETRADRAGNTLEFFEVEVERLGNELEKQSAAIVSFNNENSDALPSTLTFRLNQQTTIQARIGTLERDISTLKEQKRRLVEVFAATGAVQQNQSSNLTPEQRQLAQLEDQLNSALAIYTPENPKVKILQAQVAAQAAVVSNQAGVASEPAQSTSSSILDVQLADIDARVEIFEEQLVQAQDQLDKLVASIDRTPEVSITLNALTRDYQNTQQQYNQAVSGLSQAATGERIELLAKGRRIGVIDPATVPSKPARPNRMLISAGGAVFGAFLGLAVIAALEFLNSSIRRAADITKHLGITPIATVPYIRTPMELVVRRAFFVAIFAGLVIGLPALLYAVHTYYLPLDLIYARIAEKIGAML